MAGYSGTSLARKLGIKDGHRIALLGAPDGLDDAIGPLPAVDVGSRLRGSLDVVVFFARRRRELERRFGALKRALDPAGGLWIAWPKRSSGVETDLTEGGVREIALASGLVDNKVCAIDETWSGLRLVYRLADRPQPRS
jgi:hypothetical protein